MERKNYKRRDFLKSTVIAAVGVSLTRLACRTNESAAAEQPNIILMMTDDQGYQDVGCFGAEGFSTPHLDELAKNGTRFTDFYVGAPVCTPSRAALLTGCYPQRVGLPDVVGPKGPAWTKKLWNIGLSQEEVTVADMLKQQGYATACFGKWHLGHLPEFLPTRHGFDEYFGLPYSNDMCPDNSPEWPDLPLMEGEQVIQLNPDQSKLTTRYTERAVQFIEKNKDRPFFIYLAHSMPHVPLAVSEKFKGKSARGLYGDVIMEIDWSVGRIVDVLKKQNLEKKTIVIFISDNGPWLVYGDHAGSAAPLREGKFTTFDGGQRVPCIMSFPGRIPGGRICHEMITEMDILPTLAHLAAGRLPEAKIDGLDIWQVISGELGTKSPHEAFYFYMSHSLEAVRSGRWKLHFAHPYQTVDKQGAGGKPGHSIQARIEQSLFDLENDIQERKNVADQHPDIVERLSKLAGSFDAELKANCRGPGKL
jgi:arylsulfatase A